MYGMSGIIAIKDRLQEKHKVERFNRTIEEQFVNFHAEIFRDIDEVNSKLADYFLRYLLHIIHKLSKYVY